MTDIAIIIGSTRPDRKGEDVARWVHEHAATRGDIRVVQGTYRILTEPQP